MAPSPTTRPPALPRPSRGALLLLASFVLLALANSVVNPLHEATDELRHYRFVQHIIQRRALPVQGELACRAQGHHPPLFYALAAALTAPIDTGQDICSQPPDNPFWAYRYWEVGNDNKNQYVHGPEEDFPWHGAALAAHLARALNVLLGAGVVYLTWATGRTVWPRRPTLALGATAFVAFNPMFAYMAGAINNDIIAALSGAALTLACVRLVQDPGGLSRRWGLVLGALFGMALLSKFNMAAMILLIEAALLWVAWTRKQWRLWLEANLLVAGVALLLAGWWFVRNQLLYGEPTGFQRLTELWGVRDPAQSFGVALFELPYAWTTLWGRFGYGQIPLPQTLYDGLWWLSLLALAGLIVGRWRRRPGDHPAPRAPLALLLLTIVLFFAVLFNYMLVSPAGPMGRFFFPALPALALLLFYGLTGWLRLLPPAVRPRGRRGLALGANLGLAALSLTALLGYLAPAYAPPPSFTDDDPIPRPVDAHFDTLAILRGFQLSANRLRPGQALTVDLYWEVTATPPGPYLLFVHLIDETGAIIAQRDTHPGLGRLPTTRWRPGMRFVDSIPLHLSPTAYAPNEATLSVGLYAPGAYRLPITDAGGAAIGDALPLATVLVDAPPGDLPNAGYHTFETGLALAGYAYDVRHLEPGRTMTATLYWQAPPGAATTYEVELALVDDSQRPLAASVVDLAGSELPAGESVPVTYELGLPPDLPAGTYHTAVTVRNHATGALLHLVADDGHWLGEHLTLGSLGHRPTSD